MKILVLGGYGVFGGRLVQLLLRDGHNVWAAGRSLQKAQRFTERHRGLPLQLDRSRDLSPILSVRPDVVVVPPALFKPMAMVRFGSGILPLENGLSDLDSSDDACFAALINELDAQASVPAVSPYRVRRVYRRFRLPS